MCFFFGWGHTCVLKYNKPVIAHFCNLVKSVYPITNTCACLLDWCFWGMLCMLLLLTVSSIFTTDRVIRKQHCACNKLHESDCICRKWACLASSLGEANAVFMAMFGTLLGTWCTNIGILSHCTAKMNGKKIHVKADVCGANPTWDAVL